MRTVSKWLAGMRRGGLASVQPSPAPRSSRESRPLSSKSASTPFVPVNGLEELLVAAVSDPSKRADFQRAIPNVELFAAIPGELNEAETSIEAVGTHLALIEVPGPEGGPVAALFTSEPRIAEVFGPGQGFIRFKGETILRIVAVTGAFLNPGLPYSVYWAPQTINRMLSREKPTS